MLLSARIGRALLIANQNLKLPNAEVESETVSSVPSSPDIKHSCDYLNTTNGDWLPDPLETQNSTVGISHLQPTFRTDIANK